MGDNWFDFIGPNGRSPNILPLDPLLLHSVGSRLFSQLNSVMDSSLHNSKFLYAPGSLGFQEALSNTTKLAGALLMLFTTPSPSCSSQKIANNQHVCGARSSIKLSKITSFLSSSRSRVESLAPNVLDKISSFVVKLFGGEVERLESFSMLSLASALLPPYKNWSAKLLPATMESGEFQMLGSVDKRPREVESDGCLRHPYLDLNLTRHAVETKTRIEFPVFLNNILAGNRTSNVMSEVLVGTGSKTMKIIRIKTLKVYAFGFYVHPNSVCEKLGPKYSTVPAVELHKCRDFYEDLLREDVGMTVRLVINYKGMKIKTVRDAFEKSLRARLQKTNPNTDYHCLTAFGSLFTKDIPLPKGTVVDFRRTSEGKLITEIDGNQLGAVQSRELCRAFFDIYIGDLPVSEQTKEDIGKNVSSIIGKCKISLLSFPTRNPLPTQR